jgi:hypothetical protein
MLRAVLVLSVLAGCDVGEVPGGASGADGGTTVNQANVQSFNEVMKPIIEAKGCLVGDTCHMVQIPKLASYEALVEFPQLATRYTGKPGSANILVTKGDLTGGIHPTTPTSAPYFDETQKAAVAAWIDGLQ